MGTRFYSGKRLYGLLAFAIAESGLNTPEDLDRMARAGARTFLIGESLMRQDDVTSATRSLLANPLPANRKIA